MSREGVIWDTVLVFSPGGRCEDAPAVPIYAGRAVVIEEVQKRL